MTLDTLLDSAEHVAREVMFKEREQLPPTWILSDGKETKEIATPWRDDLERAIAKIFIADIIKEYKTVAYSFVSEVWVATETKEEYESGKPYVQPRHRPDRKEMVMAFATDGTKVVRRVNGTALARAVRFRTIFIGSTIGGRMNKVKLEKWMSKAYEELEWIAHDADTSFLALYPLSVTEARLYNIIRLQAAVLDELVKLLPDEF
jgi:hypothetical protein